MIIGPEAVIAAYLFYPLRFPDGLSLYAIELAAIGSQRTRYSATSLPLLRDADGQPMVLREELGAGSIVRLALDGHARLAAVQIVTPRWHDPFSDSDS